MGEYRRIRAYKYCRWGVHRWYELKNGNKNLQPYRCLDCDERTKFKPASLERQEELTRVN